MNRRLLLTLFLAGASLLGLRAESFDPVAAEPIMDDRALLIQLAEGTRQVRLQVKNEAGEWEVFTVAHLAGDEGFIKLRVPDDVALEDCRAEVAMSDPFPYSFYQGTTKFEQPENGAGNRWGPEVAFDAAGGGGGDLEDDGGQDQVQESDLWQWRGDTLYFFNQLRGLQVFDLSDPSKPVKRAVLRMPAVGDQMYLLDDNHVLLLANYVNYSAYGWWGGDIAFPYSSLQETQAIVVKHDGDNLEIVNCTTVKGDFVESRLVGDRLYMVSRFHEPRPDPEDEEHLVWRQGLEVNSINYADPAAPTQLPPLSLSDENGWFWNSVVTASPEHLLVTTSHYDNETRRTRSRVHVIPIGRSLESMEVAHEVQLKANLPDKFKLRVKDDILVTVTQRNVWREELTTYVESFDLSGERAEKLDQLILAPQERLHATRFDGDRLYVVTFFVEIRKDPLFVIDLTDPDNLKSLGELEIPGWSNYLVPEGDRVLSVGVEDRRVAVSLFDVSDPSKPALAERVYPGGERSWSEGNWDEKAVGYLTEEDLLLLPIQTQVKTENGYEYKTLMQLIDVTDDDLDVRGAIEHQSAGRRATVVGDHIVSISGQELLVVEASDRDEPNLVAKLELSWQAQRVAEVGDTLWQFEYGHAYDEERATPVRITSKTNPDLEEARFELKPGVVAGVLVDDDKVYVARNRWWNERVQVGVEESPFEEGEEVPEDWEPEPIWQNTRKNEMTTDVIDVSDPREPKLLGSVRYGLPDGYNSSGLDTVDGTVVNGHVIWRPQIETNNYWWGGWLVDADIAWGGGRWGWGGYGSYQSLSILSVDVSNPAEPSVVAETVLKPDFSTDEDDDEQDSWAEFGPLVAVGNKIYSSHKISSYNRKLESNQTVHRHVLREIDFANPAEPSVGRPVSVPGLLEGVVNDNGGTILISSTTEFRLHENDYWYGTSDSVLQASVYDGTQAFLVSTVKVANGRWSSTVVESGLIYKPDRNDSETGLRVWAWGTDEEGEAALVEKGFIETPAQVSNLRAHEGLVFADFNRSVGVAQGTDLIEVPLSGPVYTNGLREVDVNAAGDTAWLAVGAYGVEVLDLSALGAVGAPLQIAAQSEGWLLTEKKHLYYVLASGHDAVGKLGTDSQWQFRSIAGITDYATWTELHLNPTGESDWTMPAPDADSDDDGASNVTEFVYGTSPSDRDAHRAMTMGIMLDEGSVKLISDLDAYLGEKNVAPVVERSVDLLEWEPSEMTLEDGLMEEGENAYFRIRLELISEE